MARTPEIVHLIDDCWQQLFLPDKSLAELKNINAQGCEFLNQDFQFPPTLADITANANAKRSSPLI